MSGIQRFIKILWDGQEPNTDLINDIVVPGHIYLNNQTATSVTDSVNDDLLQTISHALLPQENQPWPKEFLNYVNQRIMFTYRTRFEPIQRDPRGPDPMNFTNLLRGITEIDTDCFTTDAGWGCMIRTGQTLLANAFQKLDFKESDIVPWFFDSSDMPFSLHKFVRAGVVFDKKPGEWFGPSTTCRSIQKLVEEFPCGVSVYIGSDNGDIYEEELNQLHQPVLILLGLRLGISQVNPVYWENLKRVLGLETCVGIAGGRPSSSHWFFGHQGEYLFYLDPHTPQSSSKCLQTYHTTNFRKLHISELDPSMLLGFLIKDKSEWLKFKSLVSESTIVHIQTSKAQAPHSSVLVGDEDEDFVCIECEDISDNYHQVQCNTKEVYILDEPDVQVETVLCEQE